MKKYAMTVLIGIIMNAILEWESMATAAPLSAKLKSDSFATRVCLVLQTHAGQRAETEELSGQRLAMMQMQSTLVLIMLLMVALTVKLILAGIVGFPVHILKAIAGKSVATNMIIVLILATTATWWMVTVATSSAILKKVLTVLMEISVALSLIIAGKYVETDTTFTNISVMMET